jgi:nitrate reductase NapE component
MSDPKDTDSEVIDADFEIVTEDAFKDIPRMTEAEIDEAIRRREIQRKKPLLVWEKIFLVILIPLVICGSIVIAFFFIVWVVALILGALAIILQTLLWVVTQLGNFLGWLLHFL